MPKLHSPLIRTRRFIRNDIAASRRCHSFPVRSMPDAGLSRRISLPQNRERYPPPHPSIRHLPPGQIAKPQIPHRRPPMLLNRLRVIRQVSHYGKPQCTVSPKKPLGFSASTKLARGLRPLDPQQRFVQPLHTGAACLTSDVENHPPDNFPHPPSACLRVPPLHPAKGIASLYVTPKRKERTHDANSET